MINNDSHSTSQTTEHLSVPGRADHHVSQLSCSYIPRITKLVQTSETINFNKKYYQAVYNKRTLQRFKNKVTFLDFFEKTVYKNEKLKHLEQLFSW